MGAEMALTWEKPSPQQAEGFDNDANPYAHFLLERELAKSGSVDFEPVPRELSQQDAKRQTVITNVPQADIQVEDLLARAFADDRN